MFKIKKNKAPKTNQQTKEPQQTKKSCASKNSNVSVLSFLCIGEKGINALSSPSADQVLRFSSCWLVQKQELFL